MASGEFPKEFFNVDTAFYLQYVHEFINSSKYPPDSALDSLSGFKYHYGCMAMAAMISEFCQFSPHKIFLGFLPVLMNLSIILVTSKIILNEEQIIPRKYFLPAVFLVISTSYFYLLPIRSPAKALETLLFRNEIYFSNFPLLSSYVGLFIAFMVFLSLQKNSKVEYKVLTVVLMGLIPIFKIPYFPIIATGVWSYSAVQFLLKKDFKIVFPAFLGTIFLLVNYFTFSLDPSQKSNFSIGFNNFFTSSLHSLFTIILFFSFFSLFIFMGGKKVLKVSRDKPYIFSFIIPFLFIISLLKIENRDSWQISILLFNFISLFLVLISFVVLEGKKYFIRSAVIFFISFLVLMPVFSSLSYSFRLVFMRSTCHEYVNNTSIAEALRNVPIENTKIVLNDIRYPADNYRRKDRQFQLSAIYGHHGFNAELYYLKSLLNQNHSDDRIIITELLQKPEWNDSIVKIAAKNKVTHLLVHKQYTHPGLIPLSRLFENKDFVLYKF
jgi:hypothetical protein